MLVPQVVQRLLPLGDGDDDRLLGNRHVELVVRGASAPLGGVATEKDRSGHKDDIGTKIGTLKPYNRRPVAAVRIRAAVPSAPRGTGFREGPRTWSSSSSPCGSYRPRPEPARGRLPRE